MKDEIGEGEGEGEGDGKANLIQLELCNKNRKHFFDLGPDDL